MDERTVGSIEPDGRLDGATGNGKVAERGRADDAPSDQARALVSRVTRCRLALAAVLLLSTFLNLYRLPMEGYANTYYAATAKNMLTSPYNFFFVCFDAGFVTVDKPPLGLWARRLVPGCSA